jgi:hypothetical protein
VANLTVVPGDRVIPRASTIDAPNRRKEAPVRHDAREQSSTLARAFRDARPDREQAVRGWLPCANRMGRRRANLDRFDREALQMTPLEQRAFNALVDDYNAILLQVKQGSSHAPMLRLLGVLSSRVNDIDVAIRATYAEGSYERNAVAQLREALVECKPLRQRVTAVQGNTELLTPPERQRISNIRKKLEDMVLVLHEIGFDETNVF